ncbi:hypothetical protein CAPTEDRAFT_209765 [Capitella teleta]|uniref:Uncharacterized protein n=1 Tax=Capitella teleta TaxID=283909 RepID=R7TQP8_CAPTE|nr:hypothetical protein CAPTEDRAFT_209765 [Capitella teleta]|eukprot:ELT96253.1 hypothetical protein CAPTEDRAFT_209765 [Capitella teleta]
MASNLRFSVSPNMVHGFDNLRAARARDCFHLPRGNQRILRGQKANVQLANTGGQKFAKNEEPGSKRIHHCQIANTWKAPVVIAALIVDQSHSASFRCTEPSQKDLHAQWTAFASSETAFAHPSVYLLPEYRHHITPSTFDSQEFALDAPSGDACAVSDDIRSSVARRSLCAWYHVISSSADRYPRDIVEAHRPDECGQRCGLSGGVCAELTFPVAVLRRTARCDEHGLYVYEGAWHDMVVGFTCTAVPEATS